MQQNSFFSDSLLPAIQDNVINRLSLAPKLYLQHFRHRAIYFAGGRSACTAIDRTWRFARWGA
jgi:hypothetical protein